MPHRHSSRRHARSLFLVLLAALALPLLAAPAPNRAHAAPRPGDDVVNHFDFHVSPVAVNGSAVRVTILAATATNVAETNYTGTVTLTSSDANATIVDCGVGTSPASCSDASLSGGQYTFVAGDAGAHTFDVTFNTPRSVQTVTADDLTAAVSGTSGFVTVEALTLTSEATAFLQSGTTPIGQSTNLTVPIKLATGLTLASIAAGAGTDFSETGTTCALNSALASGTTCNVTVSFAPTRPGRRTAPLIITDSNGLTYVLGLTAVGQGAALAFTPGTISAVTPTTFQGGTGFGSLEGADVDGVGNVYVADPSNQVIWKISADRTTATVVAGNYGASAGFAGDGQTATNTATQLNGPNAVRVDSAGDLYILDNGNSRVRRVDAATQVITTIAGGGVPSTTGVSNIPATAASLDNPQDLALDPSGNLYIVDTGNGVIRKVDPSGTLTTFAGTFDTTSAPSPNNGGLPTGAEFSPALAGVGVDAAGNIYIADGGTDLVHVVNTTLAQETILGTVVGAGDIQVIAGSSAHAASYFGDGGAATSAGLSLPSGVNLDTAGNLYITDASNGVIRRVDTTGIITTVAGNNALIATAAASGDTGPATSANFVSLWTALVDNLGSLYIVDNGAAASEAVRVVAVASGLGNDYGQVPVGTKTAPQTEYVYNVGNENLNISSLGLTSTTTPGQADYSAFVQDTLQAGDCSASSPLLPGYTCNLRIDFQPSQVQTYQTYITLKDDSGNSGTGGTTSQLELTGEGVATSGAAATLTPLYADLGPEASGNTSSAVTFTLTNPSNTVNSTPGTTLNITSASIATGGSNFTINTGASTCYVSSALISALAPQTSCTFDVTFTADADAPGSRSGSLSVVTGNAGTQTASLAGEVLGAPSSVNKVTGDSQSTTVGTAFANALKVQVKDGGGNSLPNVTVTFLAPASGASAVFSNSTNTITANTDANGFASVSVSANTVAGGPYSVTATATGGTNPSATFSLTNTPGAATHVTLTGTPANVYAGSTFNFTVTALDANNNVATGFADTVDFSSSDSAAGLPANGASLASGVGGFSATLNTAGSQFITATDASNSGITVTSSSITVYPISYNLGSEAVNSTSAATTVTFIAGSTQATSIAALTQGAASQDFAATDVSCTSATTSGNTCTVSVTFIPKAAGTRNGAVELLDTNGNILQTIYLTGNGTGPQIAFDRGTSTPQTTWASKSGSSTVAGIAVDGNGNVYQGEGADLVEVPKVGGIGSATVINSSFSGIKGIAVDGAGNLFVTSGGAYELPANASGGFGAPVSLGSGLSVPTGIAVDGAGNVFIADDGNNRVVEEPRTASGWGTQIQVAQQVSLNPKGVAVDAAGNVYVAGNNCIQKAAFSSGSYGALTPANGLGSCQGVVVDAHDNLYYVTGSSVQEDLWNGTSYPSNNQLASGLNSLSAIAIDSAGNLYVTNSASSGAGDTIRLDRADAPALSFAATVAHTTSSDSPQTVTIANIGNTTLTFNSITYATDYPNSGSSCSTSVNAGTTCALSVNFSPTTTGALPESLGLSDNNLNGSPASQSLSLSGSGTVGTLDHFAVNATSPETAGTAFDLTVTAQDAHNNTVTTYTGAPVITPTDAATGGTPVLPSG